jgi:tetrahydromethanopterin S-methyltransferase subunit G
MYKMREAWTDERLDDFRDEVNRRFDDVDKRFDKVESELQRVNDRLDGMHRAMAHGIVVIAGAIVASNAAMIGLVVTQL